MILRLVTTLVVAAALASVPVPGVTGVSTSEPTEEPTTDPTGDPTEEPTTDPTEEPTVNPTVEPTGEPTKSPELNPTVEPTLEPTQEPTLDPTPFPTWFPTYSPTNNPTKNPTKNPTGSPTNISARPSSSGRPSDSPSDKPTITVLPELSPPRFKRCNRVLPINEVDDIIPKSKILQTLQDKLDWTYPPGDVFGPDDILANPLLRGKLDSIVTYDVRVRKVCTDCEEVNQILRREGKDPDVVLPYCMSGKFAYDRQITGLVLEPIDPIGGKVVVGKMAGSIWMYNNRENPFQAPSEIWPKDIDVLAYSLQSDFLPGALAAASSGTFAFVPNLLGYANDWDKDRSWLVKDVYQASTIPLLLKYKEDVVDRQTLRCYELEDRYSVFGGAGGGYGAAAVLEGLDHAGFTHTYSGISSAPIRISGAQMEAVYLARTGGFTQPAFLSLVGNAYSSTNQDMVNTDRNQNFISDAFLDAGNELRNVKAWIKSGINLEQIETFLPTPPEDPLSIINPDYVKLIIDSFDAGDNTGCKGEFAGDDTSLLCQALIDNDLAEYFEEEVNYPVTFCHSPQDMTIFYTNLPDFSKNDNLRMIKDDPSNLASIIDPQGQIMESQAQCLIGFMLPFADEPESSDLRKINSDGIDQFCYGITDSPTQGPTFTALPPLIEPDDLRECNEDIETVFTDNRIPTDVILDLLYLVVDTSFPPADPPSQLDPNDIAKRILRDTVKFEVRAKKVCTSCTEAIASWDRTFGASDDFPDAIDAMPYCSEGSTAYGRTISGLVLEPIDPVTKSPIAGNVAGAVWFGNDPLDPFACPSQIWPENVALLNKLGVPFLVGALGSASSGAFSFIPDMLGNSNDWRSRRSWLVREHYQASAMPLVVKVAADKLEETPLACTRLDGRLSSFGYGSGGYGAAAAAQGIELLNFRHTYVGIGGAPTGISGPQLHAFYQYALNNFPMPALMPRLGNAYSSTRMDMANTNTGQNFLSDAYMSTTDDLNNAVKWIEAGLTYERMAFLLPRPETGESFLDLTNSNFNLMVKRAVEKGETEVCKTKYNKSGLTDKLCEALIDNDLTDYFENVDYDVTFCHSPNDERVYFTNVPDISKNPDHLRMIQDDPINPGGFINPTGGHMQTSTECLFGYLLPFVTPNSETNKIIPVDVAECYPSNAPSTSADPTSSPSLHPTITMKPTDPPTKSPTKKPTPNPTATPTAFPTESPSKTPTKAPTNNPTKKGATGTPTKEPTEPTEPAESPTTSPTRKTTGSPVTPPTINEPPSTPNEPIPVVTASPTPLADTSIGNVTNPPRSAGFQRGTGVVSMLSLGAWVFINLV